MRIGLVILGCLASFILGTRTIRETGVTHTNLGTTPLSNSTSDTGTTGGGTTTRTDEPKSVLIWSDEFTGGSINPSKWNLVDKASKSNNELQYYSKDNVFIYNDNLVIQSNKEEMGGKPYTSGEVTTQNKFSFTYGNIEFRAKLPGGKGIFPAMWLRPTNGQLYPEIDIMEMLGSRRNWVYLTYHYQRPDGSIGKDVGYCIGPDFTADYHTFALNWEPGKLTWLVDGKPQFSTTHYVTNQPKYITINTAVGGNWPGAPTAETVFPQHFFIDYVRVTKPVT